MHSLLSQNAIPSVVHAANARQYRQSLIRPRFVTALRAADGPAPSSSNGSKPDAPEPDDPVAAMMWAAQQDGVQVLFDEDGEDADYDDILEDLEDPWMRNPSPPEWSESPLFVVPGSTSSTQAGSSNTDTIGSPGTSSSSSQDALPGSQVATVNWKQLQEFVQQQQQEQWQQEQQVPSQVILLEVLCPDGQDQQQQQPCRPLPEHLLQRGSNTQQQDGTMQQQQQSQELPQQEGQLQVQRVSLGLSAVTRDVALEWQQQAAVVAVWDSGHHSCLAAAIRLSAVYRLSHVVLLQQQ